ncbi:ArsR family transcriptional regulator [Candidatus Cryosericum hinesii]|uniref:ArsR family transcriptional regulator n=1 Tax=Candidatus Cryosericum hinesii TaxID=2290915 RepID=A0A398D9T3_9BACT|nr:metalloregulator ArsR/SmtB family transcription factor [Candidatus Cryosericum hinesii]RIE10746.1 ArsR family transcriptional regulator [Candidatus Cryosericum hinesii]RIE12152.1 ArsR family transcriptional regulator [Candidatus Cryosericum hinesii]RIE14071.1 ArsR family transcriptional regulator [Candidatus Cryosericum hinesii]
MQTTSAGKINRIWVAKALGDQTRARIVGLLGVRALCVCELKVALSLSQATVSDHLRVLVEAGLLMTSKRSYWTLYTIRDDLPSGILGFMSLLTAQVHAEFPDDRNRLTDTPAFVCNVIAKPMPAGRHQAEQHSRKPSTSK